MKIKVNIAFNPFIVIYEPIWAHKMLFEGVCLLDINSGRMGDNRGKSVIFLSLRQGYSLILRQIINNYHILCHT